MNRKRFFLSVFFEELTYIQEFQKFLFLEFVSYATVILVFYKNDILINFLSSTENQTTEEQWIRNRLSGRSRRSEMIT